MKPEIKAWLEKVTERAAMQFQDYEDPCSLRGMWYCSQVGWDLERIKSMVGYMRDYGETEETIDEIRQAYKAWCMK